MAYNFFFTIKTFFAQWHLGLHPLLTDEALEHETWVCLLSPISAPSPGSPTPCPLLLHQADLLWASLFFKIWRSPGRRK